MLINRGINKNQQDTKDGMTALHLAAEKAHAGVVRALIEGGVDTELQTKARARLPPPRRPLYIPF